jgi:hypothetical protein
VILACEKRVDNDFYVKNDPLKLHYSASAGLEAGDDPVLAQGDGAHRIGVSVRIMPASRRGLALSTHSNFPCSPGQGGQ